MYTKDDTDPEAMINGRANQAIMNGQVQPYQRPAAIQDLSAVPTRNNSIPDIPQGAGKAYVDGLMARKQLEMTQSSNDRSEEQLNMTKEEFGYKRQQVEKELTLQNGMTTAAQQGGYNGVISYLQQQDPEKAMQFTDAKLKLDDHILNNSVLQATSQRDKAAAMVESYGVLGKMGAALMAAPAEDRENMYHNMMPIVKTVNPAAPENLQEAVPMFMLAMAQSIPANQFWGNKTTAQKSQSAADKLNQDIEARQAKGESPDTSPELHSLFVQRDGLMAKAQKAQWDADNYQTDKSLQQGAAKQTIINGMQSKYNTDSKTYRDYLDNSTSLRASLATYAANPDNSDAQSAIGYRYARIINGAGPLVEGDLKRLMENNAALTQGWMDLKNLGTGQKMQMTPTQVKNTGDVLGQLDMLMSNKQGVVNQHYSQQLDSRGMERGSLSFVNSAPPAAIDYLNKNATKENQDMFYNKYGYLPYLGSMNTERQK